MFGRAKKPMSSDHKRTM
jgi:hypothetical protein